MRWLVHGSRTSSAVSAALVRRGDTPTTPAEIELPPDAPAAEVIKAAEQRQLDLITTDPALAAAPFEQPVRYQRSLVYLQLTGGDAEQEAAVNRLFERYKRLTPGRMYTVTGSRVKIRQLPRA
jgi:hypothetical protein